jgi:hypothetical protein
MVPREFGRAFGFDNHYTHEEEAMTSPPPTITRRIGKLPRSPIPQSMPQSMPQSNEQPTEPPTDTPDTDEDAYENEHTTPTPIRKRPSADTRIPQTETSISQSSIEAMMVANMQMMQTFMQTIERMAPSR